MRDYISVALYTAAAIVLTIVTIPMPVVSFLKLDLSVVMIYLVFDRLGVKFGFLSLFLTMLFNILLKGPTPFLIGQVAYIIAFILFYYSFKFLNAKFSNKFIGGILTVFVMVVVMTLFNFFVITPIYALAYGGAIQKGLIFTLPTSYTDPAYIMFILSIYPLFNLLQWGVNTLIISSIKK